METEKTSFALNSGCNSMDITEIPNLTSINDDCKQKIFDYLEYGDLINIAETSKKLHTAVHAAFKRKYGNGKLSLVPVR